MRIIGWLVAKTQPARHAPPRPKTAPASSDAIDTNAEAMAITPDDTTVNAGFSGSKSGQRKKPYKRNNEGPSSLDRILDRPCQIHGTPDKQANHTNRDCWVFKQAGKLNAENKEKGSQSEHEDEEPR